MCVPTFSQNFRKSVLCLVWRQTDKSEIKYPRESDSTRTTPKWVEPSLSLLIPSLFTYYSWENNNYHDNYVDRISSMTDSL